MSIRSYSNTIVNIMLSWLKGLANWVLRLFNLAGNASGSPLVWLSDNWLHLLIFLMILGIAGDFIIWILRWRPHWVWFRKERIIINNEKYLKEKERPVNADGALDANWGEKDFIVVSEVTGKPSRKRASAMRAQPTAHHSPQKQTARRTSVKAPAAREADLFEIDPDRPGSTTYDESDVFNIHNYEKK